MNTTPGANTASESAGARHSRWSLIVGAILVLAATIPMLIAVWRSGRLSAEETQLVGTWMTLNGLPPAGITVELRSDRSVVWRIDRKPRGDQVFEILEYRGRWRARSHMLEIRFPGPGLSVVERFTYLIRVRKWPARENVLRFTIALDAEERLSFQSDDRAIFGVKQPDGTSGTGPVD